MADPTINGNLGSSSLRLKTGLAEMLKGGVIMDVMNVEQARIAEEAGATSVMALERVPAMIRAEGGVARMANPKLIKQIIGAVSIPVMAKARIGHFAEAQVLEALAHRVLVVIGALDEVLAGDVVLARDLRRIEDDVVGATGGEVRAAPAHALDDGRVGHVDLEDHVEPDAGLLHLLVVMVCALV